MKIIHVMPALALVGALGGGRAERFVVEGGVVAASMGTSSNQMFRVAGAVSATQGHPPARGVSHDLTGGAWSWVHLVPTEGMPALAARVVPGGIEVSWEGPATLRLWEAPDLSPGAVWWPTRFQVATSNHTHRIAVPVPSGSRFFRLAP